MERSRAIPSNHPTRAGDPTRPEAPPAHPLLPHSAGFDAEAWFATPEWRETPDKKLLEIVVVWEGVVLDIRHYKAPRRIAFGTSASADFHVPLDTATDDPTQDGFFPLIEPVKNGFLLCFYPEMNGVIEENGERLTFLDLVKEGRAHCFDRTGRCYYPLLPGAKCFLKSNGLELQIQYVNSPQFSMQWSRHLGTYAPVLSFSIITHLFMAMLAIATATPPKPAAVPPTKQEQTQPTRPTKVTKLTGIRLAPVKLCVPAPGKHNNKRRNKQPPSTESCDKLIQQLKKQSKKKKPCSPLLRNACK